MKIESNRSLIVDTAYEVFYAFKIYIFWTASHALIVHTYNHFCTPKEWYSFALSPIYVSSPFCSHLLNGIKTSSDMMREMFAWATLWAMPKLIKFGFVKRANSSSSSNIDTTKM